MTAAPTRDAPASDGAGRRASARLAGAATALGVALMIGTIAVVFLAYSLIGAVIVIRRPVTGPESRAWSTDSMRQAAS